MPNIETRHQRKMRRSRANVNPPVGQVNFYTTANAIERFKRLHFTKGWRDRNVAFASAGIRHV